MSLSGGAILKNAGFHGFLYSWFLWQEEKVQEFVGPSFDLTMKDNVSSKFLDTKYYG